MKVIAVLLVYLFSFSVATFTNTTKKSNFHFDNGSVYCFVRNPWKFLQMICTEIRLHAVLACICLIFFFSNTKSPIYTFKHVLGSVAFRHNSLIH